MRKVTHTELDATGFTFIIADDHPTITFAVSQMLADILNVAATSFTIAHTSASLLEICAQSSASPRIIVLDLVMPGDLKRVALVRALLAADKKLRLLVYTADESAFLACAVMHAGALGYVAKTSPTSELIDALVAVVRGHTYADSHIKIDSVIKHAWTSLTDSERAVLVAFCRGAKANEIVSITGRSYSTVTTHKYNGLNKLGLRDGADLLPYIYINGLLHELDDE